MHLWFHGSLGEQKHVSHASGCVLGILCFPSCFSACNHVAVEQVKIYSTRFLKIRRIKSTPYVWLRCYLLADCVSLWDTLTVNIFGKYLILSSCHIVRYFRLKYLNSYRIDLHDVLYLHGLQSPWLFSVRLIGIKSAVPRGWLRLTFMILWYFSGVIITWEKIFRVNDIFIIFD